MSKLKKQVTLTQSTINTLTTLGLGSLSMGIELLLREQQVKQNKQLPEPASYILVKQERGQE
jgi:hypothetical protein